MWTPKLRTARTNTRLSSRKRWGGLGQLLRHIGPRRMQLEPLEERTLLSVGSTDDSDQLLVQSLSAAGFTAPDCLTVSEEALAELETGTLSSPPPAGSRPYGAAWYDTSEYMLGDVWVTVVLLESNGTIDAQTENWSASEINQVKSEIREGLTWWEDTLAAQTGVLNDLSFTVDFTYADAPVQTGYEPITRSSTDQALWMNSFLDQVSHNTANSEYYDLKLWADDQRIAHNTDWAFTIFVVDSSADTDGKFSNGRFAYASLGGPYVVMTYDNDGWGISDMSMVIAHETGHTFYALDEYSGSGCTYSDVCGYYGTQNLNAYDGNPNPSGRVMSMMAEATSQDLAYAAHTSSPTSLQMLGWFDSDADGIYDVLDVTPTLTGSGSYNDATGNFEFSGTSVVKTLDNKNVYGGSNDITTNTIDLLQYRLDGGGWIDSSVSRMYSGSVSLDVPVGSGHHTLEFRTAVADSGLASNALSFEFDVDAGLVDLVIDANDAAAGSANNGSGDEFLVQLDSSGALVEIYVNTVLVQSVALATVQSITIQGSSDLDTLTVNNSNGLVNPSGGIAFNGEALGSNTGTGDLLVVQGDSPTGPIARETYTVAGPRAGTLVLDPDGSAGIGAAAFVDDEQVIAFNNLSLLTSTTGALDLDVFLTDGKETSEVVDGPMVGALQTAVVAPQDGSFLPIRFAGKTNVSVNTLGGSDELTVNLTTAAVGLAALSVYGHALNDDGPNVTATANETFHLYATPAGVTTTLSGQGGADSCSNLLSGSPGLGDLKGPVNVDGGTNPSASWTDSLRLIDTSDVTGDLVTLTATDLIGAGPANFHYLGLEEFMYEASRGADTIDILSTAAGVGYTISGTGASDVITVGNTRANFDAGIRNGSLDAIAGSLLLKGGWHLPEGLDDRLNIDDSGTLASDTQASISDIASMRDSSTGWILEHVTKIAGFGLAGGEILCPTDDSCGKWEVLNIRAGQGGNTIDVQLTSATVSTTIDAGTGSDTITINGNALAAANTFLGNTGNDRFVLNVTGAVAGASLSIQGGEPASAPSNRDVLEIADQGDLARDVAISYPSAVDGSVNVTGLGTAVAVGAMETLTYTGGATNDDAVSVHATPAADLIAVAPLAAYSARILVNGGLAGGAAGPDLLLAGLDASNGLLIDGSSPTNVLPGDVLVYESDGAGTLTPTTTGAGTITQTGLITVAYQDIEEVQQVEIGDVIVDADDDGMDSAGDGDADEFLLRLDSTGTLLEIFVNGVALTPLLWLDVPGIRIHGSSDVDTLIVDNSNGLVNPAGGITFDGEYLGANAAAGDTLVVHGDSPIGPIARETYTVAGPGAGTLVLDPDGNAGVGVSSFVDDEQVITFTGLSPVISTTTATDFDSFFTNGADQINIVDGPVVGGLQTAEINDNATGTFELIRFANKTNASVNTLGGMDRVTLEFTQAATGLATLSAYGNERTDGLFQVDDNRADTFLLLTTAGGLLTSLFGQGGADDFRNNLTGSSSLEGLDGSLSLEGGAGEDRILLEDAGDLTADTITLTATALIGACPVTIQYSGVEKFGYRATNLADTIDILSTAANACYTIDGMAESDVFTIGNTRANFEAGIRNGSLDNLAGMVLIRPGWPAPEGPSDRLNIDDSGSLIADDNAAVCDIATMTDPVFSQALTHVTSVAGFGVAGVDIFYPPQEPNSLEYVYIRAGQGGNTIDVQLTTAVVNTTIDSGTGGDTITINGDALTGANTFLGNTGTDRFVLDVTSAVAGTSLSIQGNDPAGDSAHRDVLEIVELGDLARSVSISYPDALDGSVDVAGLGTLVGVTGVEQLTYTGGSSSNDTVTVLTTLSADTIAVAPTGADSAGVLIDGGLAGGAAGPDLTVDGVAGLVIDGRAPTSPAVLSDGDLLFYDSTGTATIDFSGPDSGMITQAGLVSVAFRDIENLDTAGLFDLVVDADDGGASGVNDSVADEFLLQLDATGTFVEIFVNGVALANVTLPSVHNICFQGSSDQDTLTVNVANGLIAVVGAIYFDGETLGTNSGEGDCLVLTGDPGTTVARETCLVGSTVDNHAWILDPNDSCGPGALLSGREGDEQVIYFVGMVPVDSDVPVEVFDVILRRTSSVDGVLIEDGSPIGAGGYASTRVYDGFAMFDSLQFARKETLRVHGMDGSDLFEIDNPNAAQGLKAVELWDHAAPDVAATVDPSDDASSGYFYIGRTDAAAPGVSATTWSLYGQDGRDLFDDTTPAPYFYNLDEVRGAVAIFGGAGSDLVHLRDRESTASIGDVVTLTSTTLTGAAPAVITYADVEAFLFESTRHDDTINILSTNAGTSYIISGAGGGDTVTIGATAETFNTGVGSLAGILGNITVWPDFNQAGGVDRLNVDASGMDALASSSASITNMGTVFPPFGGYAVLEAETTALVGFAPALINYAHGRIGGSYGSPFEHLYVVASQGADTILVNDTTTSEQTTIDAYLGDDANTVIINGDGLSANNLFLGNAGNDRFVLNVTGDLGASGVTPLESVQIEGNEHDTAAAFNARDRLEINDLGTGTARMLSWEYGYLSGDGSQGDGRLTGFAVPVDVLTMETVTYTGDSANDDCFAVAATPLAQDELAFAPTGTNSGLVFLNGSPWGDPSADFYASLPGVAGGSLGPDLCFSGIATQYGAVFSGGVDDRLYVYAPSERNVEDDGNAIDGDGNVVIPGAATLGFASAYDKIVVSDASVEIVNDGYGELLNANIVSGSFSQSSDLTDGLVVNAGFEDLPGSGGVADAIEVSLSFNFPIRVNGGDPLATYAPQGDRLEVTAPGEINIFNDKTNPSEITITSSDPGTATPTYPLRFTSIENAILTPGNASQTVNIFGDNNDPAIDQNDNFVVVGADVDSLLAPIAGAQPEFQPDADGDNEFFLQLNGSVPIGFRNVTQLNVWGDDAAGTASAGTDDVDRLELTPYADDTPQGWGIDVAFDEGNPVADAIDTPDLLVYNGVAGVSEEIHVVPSGPETGQLVVLNAADGSVIVVIDYTTNTGIEINPNDGSAGDTDTLVLHGTDGADLATVDFAATGLAGDPLVSFRDAASGETLYELFSTTAEFGFDVVRFELGLGDDAINVVDLAGKVVEIDGGLPVGSDVLRVATVSGDIRFGMDPTSGVIHSDSGQIDFSGIERVEFEGDGTGNLTVYGTDDADTITAENDSVVVNDSAHVAFYGYAELMIAALAGDDLIDVDPEVLASVSLSVDGGPSGGKDTLAIRDALTALVSVLAAPGQVTGAGVNPIAFSNIERLATAGGVADRLVVRNASDYRYLPGAGAGEATLLADDLEIVVSGYNGLEVYGTGSSDQLLVMGTSGSDVVAVDGGAGAITLVGWHSIIANGIESQVIDTLEGDDAIQVQALAYSGWPLTIRGGDSGEGSDVLNYFGLGLGTVSFQLADAMITETGMRAVVYSGIEKVNIDAGGQSVYAFGGSGPDTITYTPTASQAGELTHAGNNTRFTVTAVASLIVSGSLESDLLIVNGTAADNTITYNRSTGMTTVNSLLPVTATAIEALQILAGFGSDTVTVSGSGGPALMVDGGLPSAGSTATSDTLVVNMPAADTVTAIPGDTPDSGALDFTAADADLSYVGMTLLSIIGTSGADTLVARGTDGNDAFAVGNDGVANRVTINSRAAIAFSAVETLTLEGGSGDDAFSVSPVGLTGTSTINVQGGDPTASDTLVVNGTAAQETIGFLPTAADAGSVTIGGAPTVVFSTTEAVTVNGQGGNDALTITTPSGSQTIAYLPGASIDAASVLVSGLVPLAFLGLGSTGSVTLANTGGTRQDLLVYQGDGADDTFTVSGTGSGLVGLNSQLGISTPGISGLELRGLEGNDTFNLTGSLPFSTTVLSGGGPSGSDIANVTGSGAAVTAALGGSSPSLSGGGLGTVGLSGIESLNLNASQGALTVGATANNDQAVFSPTGAAAGTLAVNDASPLLSFTGAATFSLNLGGGTDRLIVNGTAGVETIAVSGAAVAVGSFVAVSYTGAESLVVNGLEGADTFNVSPAAIPIFIDGGDPIGTTPGDQLNLMAGGSSVSFEAGPESDEGAFAVGSYPRVSFDHIEGLSVTDPGSILILGTNADDDITVIARDAASSPQYPLTDGVRDFTVSVNAGPEILFLNAEKLYIDALAGDDDIVVRAPAPNGADWDVDVYVAGGTPAPDTGRLGDVLVLETPGNNSVVFTPTGADTGTLALVQSSNNSTITMGAFSLTLGSGETSLVYTSSPGGVDRVAYDGENGVDQFQVALSASLSEVVTYGFDPSTSKGSIEIDAGQLQRLGVDFSNISNNGQIAISDAGGTDVLVYDATDADDVISVSSGGVITNLTGFVPLATVGIETLCLMGFEGDDVFNIATGHPFTDIDVSGGDPSESDVLNLYGNTSAQTVAINLGPATITGFGGTISYLGVELVNVDGGGGSGVDTLTANATAVDDRITYTPTGSAAGAFLLEGSSTSFAFSQIAGTFTINGGDELADEVVVLATNNHDVITVDARNAIRTVTVQNVLGVDLKPVKLGSTVESVTVQGRLGNDTFLVVPDAGIAPLPLGNLLINIDGGAPSASDALVIAADAAGTALDNDAYFVIVNHSRTEDEGVVRIFRDTAGTGNAPTQLPDISFVGVEVVSPLLDGVDAATGDPNLLILGPDKYEQNEYRSTAAYLGSGSALNITDLAIFPNATEHPFVPADQDWFRFVAQTTGTLDFQVYFQAYSTELLPGGGDLDIAVYDASGDLIDSCTGLNDDERIRIPVVAGQTYYLRVFGNDNAVNGYDMTVVNTASPVPYDLELDDSPANGTTNPPGQTDNSDTGRSQTDNITYDSTPVVRFCLDDGFFLHDLPGNSTDDNPPDHVIAIPFNSDQTATTDTAGYRIAIFDEASPQTIIGYARQIAEGVYEFNFATDALNPANPDGSTTSCTLSDGSHFLSARVEIIDPATPNETGLSGRSVSLEIVVDTIMPTVSFGETAVADDGLHPDSDTGVEGQAGTFTDNVTSDTTPTFWGYAEADAYIRVYVDVNNDGVVTAGVDVQIAQTVAIASDGTNQYANGYWEATSYVDLNDPEAFPTALAVDGVRHILVTAEDVAGNLNKSGVLGAGQTLTIFVDTRGPQVSGVYVTDHETYDLFDPKPSTDGPTPLVESLDIVLTDRPARISGFLYPAVNEILAAQKGNIVLVGDNSGVISIASIEVIDETVVGGVVRTTVRLNFTEPLPDDRYTLTVSDRIKDDAGNALDGESNAQEPQEVPAFPSGDGDPGEDFLARFTVDTRPEIGVWGAGSVNIDINGNFTFDTQVDDQTQDSTNRDIAFKFGYTSDNVFAGKFTGPGADGIFDTADDPVSDGFDKLAAYGQVDGQYRWLIDTNNDGVADVSIAAVDDQGVPGPGLIDPAGINGLPVAGNFDGNASNGDEVGLFTGTSWWLDTNHDYQVDTEYNSPLGGGYPVVGDFDGDGLDDLATWCDDVFRFDLAFNGFGQQDASIAFGFTGVREQPAVADMDADGIDDLGLFVPDHSGSDVTIGQWYFLISNDYGAARRVTGTINTLAHAFTPEPFGSDVFAQFGDALAMPLVGNFDPPVTGETDEPALSTRTLIGTTGNDVLEITPGESGRWKITLNGVEYAAAGETVTISFDGLGGKDTVRVTGTDGTETVTLKPGNLEITGDGFTITATNVENLRVDGAGGADTVRMYDGAGNDILTVKPGTATLTGSVTYTALNFETVHAYASAGTDTAYLYDSAGDNLMEMSPNFGRISGDGIMYRAVGFETIQGYASTGKDRATFAGTTGNDTFQATPNWARMTGTGFTKRQANGFDTVEAYGNGGSDTASLSGSASSDDTLKAWATKATLSGTGYKHVVDGFSTITVYGGAGGNDTAQLNDSTGDDTFRASPQTASMSYADTGYLVSVSQFELIQGISSGKGKDTAYLYDSTGNDTFWANSTLARMYGTAFNLRARNFDYVQGIASSGYDVARLFGTTAAEQVIAESSQTRLIGKTFFHRARYFDEVYTEAGGGNDTATVYDATVPTGYGVPAGMTTADFAHFAWLYNIEKVQVRKTSDSSQKTDIDNVDAVFAYWS